MTGGLGDMTGGLGDMTGGLGDEDYQRLLAFRDGLRQFQSWSARRAGEAGLTPAQHQLLLAIRGHAPSGPGSSEAPAVGDVAGHLLLRHHSVVGLVDRTVAAGLVERLADPDDHRVVRLRLTPTGKRRLASLSALHLDELNRLSAGNAPIWAGLDAGGAYPALT